VRSLYLSGGVRKACVVPEKVYSVHTDRHTGSVGKGFGRQACADIDPAQHLNHTNSTTPVKHTRAAVSTCCSCLTVMAWPGSYGITVHDTVHVICPCYQAVH